MKQKTKNLFLFAFFALLLVIAYKFSFSNTLELKEKLDKIEAQIQTSSTSSVTDNYLREREVFLDSIINKNSFSESLQNDLLEVLNKHSKQGSYKIISFDPPHIHQFADSTTVTSYNFVLEGRYEEIERILYILEQEYSFGSLAHIYFEKKKDYKLNKDLLQCSVVMQNVR